MKYCRLISAIFLVCTISLLAACNQQGTSSDSEAALKQKVRAEWDSKVKKNWGAVYDMATNAYKKTINRDDFIQRANIQIETFDIKEVKVLTPKKEGQAIIDYTLNQMDFKFHTAAKEKWIWENGDWHLHIPPAAIKK